MSMFKTMMNVMVNGKVEVMEVEKFWEIINKISPDRIFDGYVKVECEGEVICGQFRCVDNCRTYIECDVVEGERISLVFGNREISFPISKSIVTVPVDDQERDEFLRNQVYMFGKR